MRVKMRQFQDNLLRFYDVEGGGLCSKGRLTLELTVLKRVLKCPLQDSNLRPQV